MVLMLDCIAPTKRISSGTCGFRLSAQSVSRMGGGPDAGKRSVGCASGRRGLSTGEEAYSLP